MKMTDYQNGVPSWVDLGTPDMDATKAFYSGLFGWSAQTSDDPATGGYTMFEYEGAPVAGAMPLMNPEQPVVWTSYISVDDADKVADAVSANGGTVMFPPMDVTDVGRMSILVDPAGGVFGTWQPRAHKGAGVVNEPNTLCWNELCTRDAAGAKAFYPAVFGWGTKTDQMDGGMEYTEWQLGGKSVGGMVEMNEMFPPEVPTHWAVYFAVADTDAAHAKAVELGAETVVPPSDIPNVGRFAQLRDPQGAHFSIIKMNAEM
jgi:uncharacterized protein